MESKKSIIIEILKILQKHSDINHPLTQKDVVKLLESEYNHKVDRKTVSRNISFLLELGYPIESENEKKEDGERNLTNLYYRNALTDGEIHLLISSILFTSALPEKVRKELIKNLEGLSNKYFKSISNKIDMGVYNRVENYDIINTFEIADAAITEEKMIKFNYCNINLDFKLDLRKNDDNTVKEYIVSPYQFVSSLGHTYLICCREDKDGIFHFRLDRMKNAELLSKPAKPMREIKGFEDGLKLSEYLAEHPNLWSGEVVNINMDCKKELLNHIVDSFGTQIKVSQKENGDLNVRLKAGKAAMKKWAIQFCDSVEVLSPIDLRNDIASTLKESFKKYNKKI